MGKVLLDFDFKHFGERMRQLTSVDLATLGHALREGDLQHRYEAGRLTDDEFYRDICFRIGKNVAWEDFVSAWNSVFDETPLLPEDLIARLGAKANLWVLSNTNNLHFSFILDRYSFLRHFQGFILSHEVGALKPDPRIFSAALDKTGADPPRCLFVDDQLANVEVAKHLGLDAFQFLDQGQFAREMRERGIL